MPLPQPNPHLGPHPRPAPQPRESGIKCLYIEQARPFVGRGHFDEGSALTQMGGEFEATVGRCRAEWLHAAYARVAASQAFMPP